MDSVVLNLKLQYAQVSARRTHTAEKKRTKRKADRRGHKMFNPLGLYSSVLNLSSMVASRLISFSYQLS